MCENEQISKTSMTLILYEIIYATISRKMLNKMDIMMNIISILQRNTTINLDKEHIIDKINKLEKANITYSCTEKNGGT